MTRLLLALATAFFGVDAFAQLIPEPIQIPMRDGKNLSAHLYRPNQQDTFPVILIQTPYNKAGFMLGLPLGVEQNIAQSEYAFVVMDWRCFYGSQSACVANPNRGEDGYDAVEWIAEQPWCNGKIGTWGPSALGNIQFQTTKEQPPHLVCAAPLVASPHTHYQQYFPGGAARTEYLETLNILFSGSFALIPQNPYYNIIWQAAENSTMYPADIVTPMLLIAGWFDHNTEDDLLMFDTLRALSPASSQHRLLVGPWTHGGTGPSFVGSAQQGDLSFPQAAGWQNIIANQFFAYYLLGENNGWENTPFIQYFQMGDNEWLTNDVFPPSDLTSQSFYLTDDGKLVPGLPFVQSTKLNLTYDPNDPSPTIGGKTLNQDLLQGPYDQSQEVETRNDVLIFTTDVLQKDLVVKGKIKTHLYVASDRKDTDFALRLTEVYPDGSSVLLGESIQRMRFRKGYRVVDTAFMKANEVYPITLSFDHLANTFQAGNRIRLIVSSSNYPRYNRNMNTGGDMYPGNSLDTLVNPLVATNSVFVNSNTPSHIELPVDEGSVAVNPVWEMESVRIFPNPASGEFRLENLPVPSRLRLTDITGKVVREEQVTAPDFILKMENQRAGTYFLLFQDSTGRVYGSKVIVLD
jgi:hypothetical protein